MKRGEQGRSLTEMLGVLAIIGVLSIASILGYSYAINKHRANDTINQLNQYALIASGQAQRQQAAFDLSEQGNTTRQGYSIVGGLTSDPNYFELALSNVPSKVCEQILKSGWKQPLVLMANEVAYSGNSDICDKGDETPANMRFQFDIYLDATALPLGACRDSSDCSAGCTACVSGQCESICVGDERCATDTQSGVQVCCPADKRAGLMCCAFKHNGMCCNNYGQCCPWYKPLIDTNEECYACDYTNSVSVTGKLDNCSVCTNRELSGNICRVKCSADKPLRDAYGSCRGCDEEGFIYVGTWGTGPKTCSICPNRVYTKGYCGLNCGEGKYGDKPLTDAQGMCHACDEKVNFTVTGVTENCAVCPNRVLTENQCSWPCPIDKPLPDSRGACHACDEEQPIFASSSCTLCPNRIWFNYLCVLKCGEGIYADKLLRGSDGNCYSCEEPKAVHVKGPCSETCPNRYLVESQCVLNKCNPNEIQDINGKCFSCDVPNTEIINVYGMAKYCTKQCPNRVKVSQYCALPCGEGIYADKPLTDRYGKCYTCDEPKRVDLYNVTQNCAGCPNRKLEGYNCVLK